MSPKFFEKIRSRSLKSKKGKEKLPEPEFCLEKKKIGPISENPPLETVKNRVKIIENEQKKRPTKKPAPTRPNITKLPDEETKIGQNSEDSKYLDYKSHQKLAEKSGKSDKNSSDLKNNENLASSSYESTRPASTNFEISKLNFQMLDFTVRPTAEKIRNRPFSVIETEDSKKRWENLSHGYMKLANDLSALSKSNLNKKYSETPKKEFVTSEGLRKLADALAEGFRKENTAAKPDTKCDET